MRIKALNRGIAVCEAKGIEREVNLLLLGDESLQVGDYLSVSLGYAQRKIDPVEARAAWALYDEILAADA